MEFDYLIVGQGIAGTAMAHVLEMRGHKVLVIDKGLKYGCTSAAAGLVNPITGKRLVLVDQFDRVKEIALKNYRQLEEKLDIRLISNKNTIRQLLTDEEVETWQSKRKDAEFSRFCKPAGSETETLRPRLRSDKPLVEMTSSFQIDVGLLIHSYRRYLQSMGRIWDESFKPGDLEIKPEGVYYRGVSGKGIVFCEGAALRHNPWFNYLPIEPSAGQAMVVELEGAPLKSIYKGRIFIAPMDKGSLHWIGSHNNWDYQEPTPVETAKKILSSKLQKSIINNFTPLEMLFGLRCNTKDRLPLAGPHPETPHLFVLNGLASKGTSLAPYLAENIAQLLERGGGSFPEEVLPSRFPMFT